MNTADESNALSQSIDADERKLHALREQEIELLEHITRGDFSCATKREALLTEMKVIEQRLNKNRRRLASKS